MVKKNHFVFILLCTVICTSISLISCSEETSAEGSIKKETITGEQIYKQNCTSCHGPKGDLGISGAANLKISIKTTEQKIDFIKKGSEDGIMAAYGKAYGGVLSKSEINKVADYIDGFTR